jgi:branched-chain amino acid aminotransferase
MKLDTNNFQWFITPIATIKHHGQDINIPTGPDGSPAEITGKIKGWLADIMYGRVEHEWATAVPEKALE